MRTKEYQICSKCVMDTTDPDIVFNEEGICNYCLMYEKLSEKHFGNSSGKLDAIIAEIKAHGKNKQYDCVIGVSGGVDSSFVAHLVHKFGLRPLAIHIDNGWNSELAVKNIEQMLKKMNIDLYTEVLDWEEFKDLQRAFILSGTPDLEIPTDHALSAVLYKKTVQYGIKYLIMGGNITTEAIMPKAWSHGMSDWKYIKSVHKKFGKKALRTYPHFSLLKLYYYSRKIRKINILNYVSYNKDEAKRILINEYDWKDYGGKHYESIYTRFYQSYILPVKFGFDKRKGHYSTLINSGQMTREEALERLKEATCTAEMIRDDKEYLIKKLDFTKDEFEEIINTEPKRFWDYPSYENSLSYKIVRRVYKFMKQFTNKEVLRW